MEKMKSTLGMSESEGSIFNILKAEHKQVGQNFQQIINTKNMTLYSQTLGALTVHMSGEESLLYPKLEANSNTRHLALKAYEEHNAGKAFVGTITSTQADDKWVAQVEVLFDMLAHHIEVEEKQIFPTAAKNVINEKEALEIGRAYRARSQSQMPITATT